MAGRVAVSRALSGGLSAPTQSILIADFTDGSHSLSALSSSGAGGDVQYDAGFPNAGTRAYGLDTRGAMMSFQSGTTGQYAALRYIPDGKSAGALIDLSNADHIAVEIEFPEGGGQTYDAIEIWIAQQTGNTFTNYLSYTPMSGADKNPKRCVVVARFSSMAKSGGGPSDMSKIGKIDIRMSVHSQAQNVPAVCYVRRIWKGSNTTRVMFGFDDCWSSQLTIAAPMLAAAGIKATVFPSTSHVGLSQRMSLADLGMLYNTYGWDVGGHLENHDSDIPCNLAGTLTSVGNIATWVNRANIPHGYSNGQLVPISGSMEPAYNGSFIINVIDPVTFTYVMASTPTSGTAVGWISAPRYTTDAAMIAGSVNARAYWAAAGFSRALHFIAYPNGVYNDYTVDLLIAAGFKMGRTSNVGAMPSSTGRAFDPRGATARSLMEMPSGILDQATGATALTWVYNAIERGLSIWLYGHKQAAGVGVGSAQTMDSAELQTLVTGVQQLVQQGRCVTDTASSLFNSLYGRLAA